MIRNDFRIFPDELIAFWCYLVVILVDLLRVGLIMRVVLEVEVKLPSTPLE
jgi:hypothetical protein